MSYIITLSNGTDLIAVPDRQIIGPIVLNTTSNCSLNLVGRNTVNYGLATASNFVWLLENFANATAPVAPLKGQIWYNLGATPAPVLSFYNSTGSWVQIATSDSPFNFAGNLAVGDNLAVGGNLTISGDVAALNVDIYNPNAPVGSQRYRIENDLTTNDGDLLISKISDAGGNTAVHFFAAITISNTDGSMTLVGNSTATTQIRDTANTTIATTAFVINQAASGADVNAIQMDGIAGVGISTHWARNDHTHPTDITRAPLHSPIFTGIPETPTPSVDDNSSNIATTAYVLGQAANGGDAATIQMDFGTVGQVGISTHWARNDHVHPTDITRAPILSPELLGSPTIQNTPPTGDNSNLIADTAFVTRAIDNVQLLPGPQGTQGDVGPQGPPGQNGTNGASASPATGFGALYTYAILQSYYNADGGAPVPGTSYPASFFVSGSAYGGGTTIAPSSGNWTCMGCIIATDVSQGGSGSVYALYQRTS